MCVCVSVCVSVCVAALCLQVLFGTSDGKLQLWNFRSGKLIHEAQGGSFAPLRPGASAAAVTVLAQSDVVDVVGVGTSSGDIVLHNVLLDKVRVVRMCWGGSDHLALKSLLVADRTSVLTHTYQTIGMLHDKSTSGGVTALSFCMNRFHTPPVVVSGNAVGAITVWNLEDRTVVSQVKQGHDGRVVSLQFLPGMPPPPSPVASSLLY